MRYTTIIDITEFPDLYRNQVIRLVYLHLSLRSGYHDHDRDLIGTSIRRLASDVGVTVSGVRNALRQLERHGLVARAGDMYQVTKWTVTARVSPRTRTAAAQTAAEAQVLKEAQNIQRQRNQEAAKVERERLRAQGKTQFMVYVESLKQRADAGDKDAERLYNQHKEAYHSHLKAIQETNKNGKL